MVKRANVHLVAPRTVALNALVLVWMVESLHGGVALAALDPLLAVVPAKAILEGLAVLGGVLNQIGRSSEVAGVMRVDAAF